MQIQTNFFGTPANLADLTASEALFVGLVTGAMSGNELIGFEYDDKQRLVEPHAIGRSTKDGGLVLRAFQTDGENSRPLPAWVLFRVDRIVMTSLMIGHKRVSAEPAAGYKMDDSQMSLVLAQLDNR